MLGFIFDSFHILFVLYNNKYGIITLVIVFFVSLSPDRNGNTKTDTNNLLNLAVFECFL